MNSQATQRYLIYDFSNHLGGLDDHLSLLKRFISLSFKLDRIPVITEFNIHESHNFNLPSRRVPFQRYLDLSKTQILEIKSGRMVEVLSSLQWISDQDFDLESYPEEKIAYVDICEGTTAELLEKNAKAIFDKSLESYTVLSIKGTYVVNSMRWHHGYACYAALRFPKRLLPYTVAFYPSQEVENLTDIVFNRLGFSRHDIMNLTRKLTEQYRLGFDMPHLMRANCFYACMHVRITEAILAYISYYFASLRSQIKKTVKAAGLEHGSKLYIMSDRRDPKHFDFLRSDYQVYQYHDFPELRQWVSGEKGEVDNYMVYSVEKNIMKFSLVKILPPGRNKQIFPLDASYRIPFFIRIQYRVHGLYLKLISKGGPKRLSYKMVCLVLEKFGLSKWAIKVRNKGIKDLR